MDKNARFELIRRLIRTEKIHTQEELRTRLAQEGVEVTQATLSRNLHEMKLVKRHVKGELAYYALAEDETVMRGLFRADYVGNTVVLHCAAGMAPAVAARLDAMQRRDIVGTLAGDDTIFILMRTEAAAVSFVQQFGMEEM